MLDIGLLSNKNLGGFNLFSSNKTIFSSFGKTMLIFSFIFLSILPLIKSYEDQETLKKRLNFYSKIQQYSNNTIKVESNPDTGLSCIANDYIEYGTMTLRIPKKLSLCPYYIFPFKYELFDTLLKIPGLNQTIGVEQRFPVYLLTYYLLYAVYAPKNNVKQYILKNKMTEYYNCTEIDDTLKDSFPISMLSMGNFDPEHFILLKELNYPIDKDQELDMVHRFILQNMSFSPHFEVLYSWISDYEKFKWAYAIVMSRGMTLRLNEYYNLENIKISDPKIPDDVKKNLNKNSILGKNVGAPCVIAFIDLCNHYQPKNIYGNDKLPIVLDTRPGYFVNSATADWNPGDEITYTYSNDPNNILLLSHYGFYIKNNLFNEQKIIIEDEYSPTLEQFNLCREIGCFDNRIKSVQQIPKSRTDIINPHSFNENLLNYGRVRFLKGKFDSKNTLKKLTADKQISNSNEMSAMIYYYKIIMNNLKEETKNIHISIKEGQVLKNKIKEIETNWKDTEDAEALWRKLKISFNIYMTDLSYKNIITKHANVILNKILHSNHNDILKLRLKYLEA